MKEDSSGQWGGGCTMVENGEECHLEGSILAHGVMLAHLEEDKCSWYIDVCGEGDIDLEE